MRKIENEKIEKIRYCLYQCKRGYILWTRKTPKYYVEPYDFVETNTLQTIKHMNGKRAMKDHLGI